MKSVLMSIQPKWVEKIASGKKTIEIRKTRPKLKTPFKCYIYCTKKKHLLAIFRKGDYIFSDDHKAGKFNETIFVKGDYYWQGKVIGEFICDSIEQVVPDYNPVLKKFFYGYVADLSPTCLSEEELHEYAGIKPIYFWHISDLKIYDKPKELKEFGIYEYEWFEWYGEDQKVFHPLKRPPQSWCYVESKY